MRTSSGRACAPPRSARRAEADAIVIDPDRRDRAARAASADHGGPSARPRGRRAAPRGSSPAHEPIVRHPGHPVRDVRAPHVARRHADARLSRPWRRWSRCVVRVRRSARAFAGSSCSTAMAATSPRSRRSSPSSRWRTACRSPASTYWQHRRGRDRRASSRSRTGVLHACEAETSMIMALSSQRRSRRDHLPQCHGALVAGTVGDRGRQSRRLSLAAARHALAERRHRGCRRGQRARRASACLRSSPQRARRDPARRGALVGPDLSRRTSLRSEVIDGPHGTSSGRSALHAFTTVDLDKPGKQVGFVMIPHSPHDDAWGVTRVPLAVIANGSGPDRHPRRRQPWRRV